MKNAEIPSEAIKYIRITMGMDLKDSKDLVDAYLQAHPELEKRFSEVRTEINTRSMFWIALAVFTILFSVIFFG